MSAATTAKPVTIGLVQIGEVVWERRPSQHFQIVAGTLRVKPTPASSLAATLAYLPHTAGLLEAYARRHAADPSGLEFLRPLYRRLPLRATVEHLSRADIVGFSVYVWNVEFSLTVARELKKQRPDVLVVMGGPQVPDDAQQFLRTHSFVDLACHGEGERTFLEILDRRETRNWDGIASVSFLRPDGRFVRNERRPRMGDLDEIPSPMLDGTYDALMRAVPDQQWLATWETNRGCPFACAFCDWGSATASKVSRYSMERLFAEVDWMADRGIRHLFVCDANFGMLPRDVEIAGYIADAYARRGSSVAVSVQNTKNRTDRSEQIQRIFQQSRVVSFGASISLQSVDANVLKVIRRGNISLDAFERLQKHYAKEGLDTYSDLIIGLPGETYQTFSEGVAKVIRNGQINRVAFYECSVLPNAPMARPEYRQAYGIETVPVRIVHAHEPIRPGDDEIREFIDVVVSTAAMNRDDWIRARVYAHLAELLFFDRVLHVPLTLLGSALGLDYRKMFEAFIDVDPLEFPVTAHICGIFAEHARAVQRGGAQYMASPECLNLWWPLDQYALIDVAKSGALDAFYAEAEAILTRCAAASGVPVDAVLIKETVQLNQAMFAVPFVWSDQVMDTTYPVAQAYLSLLAGVSPDLAPRASRCRVERTETIWMSWESWCEDLVRRVFLRKYYLYPVHLVEGLSADSPGRTGAGGELGARPALRSEASERESAR